MEANPLGPGLVEEKRRGGLKHVLPQLLPSVPLSEDVFREALRAVAAVGLLDDFEHQFCHTPMIRHEFVDQSQQAGKGARHRSGGSLRPIRAATVRERWDCGNRFLTVGMPG